MICFTLTPAGQTLINNATVGSNPVLVDSIVLYNNSSIITTVKDFIGNVVRDDSGIGDYIVIDFDDCSSSAYTITSFKLKSGTTDLAISEDVSIIKASNNQLKIRLTAQFDGAYKCAFTHTSVGLPYATKFRQGVIRLTSSEDYPTQEHPERERQLQTTVLSARDTISKIEEYIHGTDQYVPWDVNGADQSIQGSVHLEDIYLVDDYDSPTTNVLITLNGKTDNVDNIAVDGHITGTAVVSSPTVSNGEVTDTAKLVNGSYIAAIYSNSVDVASTETFGHKLVTSHAVRDYVTTKLDGNSNNYVHKSGNETIAGNKTFSNNVIVNGTISGNAIQSDYKNSSQVVIWGDSGNYSKLPTVEVVHSALTALATTIPTVNDTTVTIKKNTDDTGDSFTTNAAAAKTINLGLSSVATSGSYDDLSNKPTIPSLSNVVASAQYNSTTGNIEFYNPSGTKLNTDISAAPFTKDGMIDDISVITHQEGIGTKSITLDAWTEKMSTIKVVRDATELGLVVVKELVEGPLPVVIYTGDDADSVYTNGILGSTSYNPANHTFTYHSGIINVKKLKFQYNSDANKQDILISAADLCSEYVTLNTMQTITGAKSFSTDILPETSSAINLGSLRKRWSCIYTDNLHASSHITSAYSITASEFHGNLDGKLSTPRYINGMSFDGSSDILNYGYAVCSSAAEAQYKDVIIPGLSLDNGIPDGVMILVRFVNTNTYQLTGNSNCARLRINNDDTYTKKIRIGGNYVNNTTASSWQAGDCCLLVYNSSVDAFQILARQHAVADNGIDTNGNIITDTYAKSLRCCKRDGGDYSSSTGSPVDSSNNDQVNNNPVVIGIRNANGGLVGACGIAGLVAATLRGYSCNDYYTASNFPLQDTDISSPSTNPVGCVRTLLLVRTGNGDAVQPGKCIPITNTALYTSVELQVVGSNIVIYTSTASAISGTWATLIQIPQFNGESPTATESRLILATRVY